MLVRMVFTFASAYSECSTVSMHTDLDRETEVSDYALVLSCLLDLEGRQLEEALPSSVETDSEVA